jgi:hypothetical protein
VYYWKAALAKLYGNYLINKVSFSSVFLRKTTKCCSEFKSLLPYPKKVLNQGITYPLGYSSKSYIARYGCPYFFTEGIAYPPPAIYICWAIIAWIYFRDIPVGSSSSSTTLRGWGLELTCCISLWLFLTLWTPSWWELPALRLKLASYDSCNNLTVFINSSFYFSKLSALAAWLPLRLVPLCGSWAFQPHPPAFRHEFHCHLHFQRRKGFLERFFFSSFSDREQLLLDCRTIFFSLIS